MTSTGHGSPGQPPKNCSRRFCQSWGKRADPTACARRSAGQSWRKKRTRKSQQKAHAGKMWNRWQTRSLMWSVRSHLQSQRQKPKPKQKLQPRRLRPNPQSSQRSHPARKAKQPFHFLERVLVSQFDIAMWPFTCAQSRLPTEWSWRARRRTKPSPGRWMAQSKRGAEWDSVFCLFLYEGSPHTMRLPRLARQRLADLLATAPLEKQHVKLPQLSHDLLSLVFFETLMLQFWPTLVLHFGQSSCGNVAAKSSRG